MTSNDARIRNNREGRIHMLNHPPLPSHDSFAESKSYADPSANCTTKAFGLKTVIRIGAAMEGSSYPLKRQCQGSSSGPRVITQN